MMSEIQTCPRKSASEMEALFWLVRLKSWISEYTGKRRPCARRVFNPADTKASARHIKSSKSPTPMVQGIVLDPGFTTPDYSWDRSLAIVAASRQSAAEFVEEKHPHPGPLPSDGRGRIERRIGRGQRHEISRASPLPPLPSDGRGMG